jgi:hypothetical protein
LRAAYDRFLEEKEILEAEYERTVAWFTKTSDNWSSIADDIVGATGGSVAFAREKSAMYRALAGQCEFEWQRKRFTKPVKRPNPDSD